MTDKDSVLLDRSNSAPPPIQIKSKDSAQDDAVIRTLIDEWVVPQLVREYLSYKCIT